MSSAISAYRAVWRATGIVFKGDLVTLNSARQKIRDGFAEEREATLSADELKEKVTHVNQIATFLRQNIVQGAKTSEGDQYRLNITKDTELGDNDDVYKKPTLGGGSGSQPVVCCGGSPANASTA